MKRFFYLLLLVGVLLPLNSVAQSSSQFYLLVGTYTSESSEGIYVYKFDAETGETKYVSKAEGVTNPSYLAVSPNQEFVYAVNETAGEEGGGVSAFAFDKKKGTLTFLNRQSSAGGAPCYISVDKSGRWAFTANYSGGSLSMLPIESDGSLQKVKKTIQYSGQSVNKARQNSPHAHCVYVAPDNKYVLATDLGTDKVRSYNFNPDRGTLEPVESGVYETEPGSGPRHLTFHPSGKFAYLVNELSGTVEAFQFKDGQLQKIQQISTLPTDYEGPVTAADIHLSPDGAYLYASNREDLNNIVIYAVDKKTGKLQYSGAHASGGVHPRNFMIDPTGQFLLVANRNTDNVVVFRRNSQSGNLSETGVELDISMPVYLHMIPANQ